MRIAVGGIHIECSTYNPVETAYDVFRVARGTSQFASPMFGFLEDYPATFLPTLHARAIPGGPVTAAAYTALVNEFLDRLRAHGPVDGLYLAMHGAMFVTGMEDAEGDWISRARAVVGPDCPIAVSYDLHGNVTQKIVDCIDMFSTYRTAPHIDVEETMRRSVSMLVRSIETGVRPFVVWTPVPVVLPGERTSTVDEPARGLYAGLPDIQMADGIWDASLMVGYVWADEPRATAAAVMTGTDQGVLAAAGDALAARYWAAREAFAFGSRTGTIADCVALARENARGLTILADSGDNPTGGGVGDRADVLRELLAQGADGVILASIANRPTTDAAYAAGVGATVSLSVGGTLDVSGSKPVLVSGTVTVLAPATDARDREAVLELDGTPGGFRLVLAARRRPYHDIADFERLGLDVSGCRILVVKSGYLSPELAPLAELSLMALSPGSVDQDVARLPRHRKMRATFPFDADFDWTPEAVVSARAEAWAGEHAVGG
ncbi:MAG: M81 family metallopeptidase [Janthinobacterium lividum]